MRVKVNDVWYDCTQEMVMVELTDADKEFIASMSKDNDRYCECPSSIPSAEVDAWMDKGARATRGKRV